MNSIEIFSGAGGLAKGLEIAGAEHLAFVEWNSDACKSLRANFNEECVFEGDVREFPFYKFNGVDIIAGGPPCQPFSLGGKAQGCNDKRDMFPSAIAAIRTLMPKAFIFENVKGLLRESFADYFKYIILQLTYPKFNPASKKWRENLMRLESLDGGSASQGLKYNVTYNLVNAANYGIPQKRERVIIVGFRSDLKVNWQFPRPTHCEDALLWSMFVTGEYWQRHNISNYFPQEYVSRERQRLQSKYGFWAPELQPWKTVRDAIASLGQPSNQGDHILREGAKEYAGHTGSSIDAPSKTIKAGSHGVPGGENMIRYEDGSVRYYTVAEAKRIQTFPDDYEVSGAWTEAMRQLGNAVPVELGRIIANSVFSALDASSTSTPDSGPRS